MFIFTRTEGSIKFEIIRNEAMTTSRVGIHKFFKNVWDVWFDRERQDLGHCQG